MIKEEFFKKSFLKPKVLRILIGGELKEVFFNKIFVKQGFTIFFPEGV